MPSSVDLPVGAALAQTLDRMPRPIRVLPDPDALHRLVGGTGLVTASADEAGEQGPAYASVLLVAADVAELRRLVSVLPGVRRFPTIGVFVADAGAAISLRPRPLWPEIRSLDADLLPTDAGETAWAAVTVATFADRAPSREVLVELARTAAMPTVTGHSGLVVAVGPGQTPPPVDPTVRGVGDLDETVPPDVLVAGGDHPEPPPSEVTGRAPTLVRERDCPAALDEAVFNPRGWSQTWDVEDAEVGSEALSPALVARLRTARRVRVDWSLATAPTVAGLAMAGVPLVSDVVPPPARAVLGDPLAHLVEQPDDTADPLRREERSVRIRREALARHSVLGWRGRLGELAGVRNAAYPSVSLLLATRRPELLGFALRQVAKQHEGLPGASIEVVLAAHGFRPDPGEVAAALGDRPHRILPLPAGAVFGDVLNHAVAAASGDVVLKMDDDDWYGPDVVADLLLARRYSGADLVGMPAEFVYLEPIGVTVRRRGAGERYADVVAGGTMMIDRATLRSLGGFRPVPRHVDARLIDDVRAAGGSIYRTHGLGYLLRRTSGGHTWDPGLGYFLTRRAMSDQWRGFRPTRLLTHDETEVP